ncbi:MAG: hypothetical protein WCR13_05075, partial [Sphaerochaeta sp.]
LIIVALSFTSCNADASAGLFRQISESTEAIDITYRQLLGFDTAKDNLYYRTIEGLFRMPQIETTAGTYNAETMVLNTTDKIIQASAYDATNDKLLYFTNDKAERDANQVLVFDANTSAVLPTITVAPVPSISSGLTIKNLYANSMLMVYGLDSSGKAVYELQKFDGSIFSNTSIQFSSDIEGYSLEGVIQQTTKENDITAEIIVSFVDYNESTKTSVYKHYLVNPSTPSKVALPNTSVRIANFFIESGNVYILTSDGILYYAGTTTALAGSYTEMEDISKAYEPNAFVYPVVDSSTVHLITKPTTKSYPLYVFTFPSGATDGSSVLTESIRYGYGEYLDSASIVGALQNGSATDLLVATHENGIFDISITAASANVNTDANGDSSTSEKYTF